MSKDIRLSLRDLVPQTMTRVRGREAAEALNIKAAKASASRIFLNLSAASIVTGSFVDELVQQAARMKSQGGLEIVFIVPDASMLEKLQKSVSWRKLSCEYRLQGEAETRTLTPAEVPQVRVKPIIGTKEQIPANL